MKSENANNATINHKDIPKGWQPVVLGDFTNTKHGYAFKGKNIVKEPMRDILVTPGNFRIGGGFKNSKFKYFNGEYPKSYILKENDIIVTMTDLSKDGDTLGYSAKVPKSNNEEKYLHNQRIGLVEFLNDKIDKDFIYWLLRTKDYHGFIVGAATGTSIRHTSPTTIKEYEFFLPPLPEQKAIASMLSCLDDKIDLLHRQNKTLETIAETLFREWFIEEAKEDWEEGVLSDEFDFTMGQSPPGDSYNEEGIGIALFQGNADFGFRFPTNRVYTTDPKRFAEKYDTLVSVRAPVGAQNMAKVECCIGRGVATFRYKNNNNFYTYTYFRLRSLMDEIRKFNDEGTVFGSIGKTDFQQIKTLLPSRDLIEKFESEAKPLNDKVIENCNQIKLLEATRDTLLSRLMSGKIRVQYDKETTI